MNDNKKIVKMIGVLNAIVVADLVVSILVLIVGYSTIFDSSMDDSMLYDFLMPITPTVIFGCPLILLVSIILVIYGVRLLNKRVLDSDCTKFNLRFEIVILAISLLVVSGFYYMPSIPSWHGTRYVDNGIDIYALPNCENSEISGCSVY